eukprot:IDg8520t1
MKPKPTQCQGRNSSGLHLKSGNDSDVQADGENIESQYIQSAACIPGSDYAMLLSTKLNNLVNVISREKSTHIFTPNDLKPHLLTQTWTNKSLLFPDVNALCKQVTKDPPTFDLKNNAILRRPLVVRRDEWLKIVGSIGLDCNEHVLVEASEILKRIEGYLHHELSPTKQHILFPCFITFAALPIASLHIDMPIL